MVSTRRQRRSHVGEAPTGVVRTGQQLDSQPLGPRPGAKVRRVAYQSQGRAGSSVRRVSLQDGQPLLGQQPLSRFSSHPSHPLPQCRQFQLCHVLAREQATRDRHSPATRTQTREPQGRSSALNSTSSQPSMQGTKICKLKDLQQTEVTSTQRQGEDPKG